MTSDLVIDLDRPAPPSARPERRGRRPTTRQLLAAGLTIAVLAVVGGPDELPYRPRFAPPVIVGAQHDAFSLVADALYVGSEPLTAYRIIDGAPMWTANVPASPYRWAVRAGGVLLTGDERSTLGLDPSTGERRWTMRGAVVWVSNEAGRAATLVDERETDGTVAKPGVITVFDLATGATVWRAEYLHAGDRLVFGEYDGTPAALGVLVEGRYLPFDTLVPRELPTLPELPIVSIVDGMVLVTDAGRLGTSAYDLATLRMLWSNPDAAAFASSCGQYLCATFGNGTAALDRTTGEPRWHIPGMILASGRDVPRLTVLFGPTASGGATDAVTVIDATDGKVLQFFPGWLPIGPSPQGPPPGGGKLPDRSQAYPVERINPTSGAIEIGVLDLRRLTVYRIANLNTTVRNCRATATHVACRTKPGEIRIWRYAR